MAQGQSKIRSNSKSRHFGSKNMLITEKGAIFSPLFI